MDCLIALGTNENEIQIIKCAFINNGKKFLSESSAIFSICSILHVESCLFETNSSFVFERDDPTITESLEFSETETANDGTDSNIINKNSIYLNDNTESKDQEELFTCKAINAISVQELKIFDSNFTSIRGKGEGSAMNLQKCVEVEILDCIIDGRSVSFDSLESTTLFISVQKSLVISGTFIINHSGSRNLCIYSVSNHFCEIRNCSFLNNKVTSVICIQENSLMIEDSLFSNNQGYSIKFESQTNNLSIFNSTFITDNDQEQVSDSYLFISSDVFKVEIENCVFENCKCQNGAIRTEATEFNFEDNEISFTTIPTNYPTLNGKHESSSYYISNSTFTRCFKAIELDNNFNYASITECYFDECGKDNSVISLFPGNGGIAKLENSQVTFKSYSQSNQVLSVKSTNHQFELFITNVNFTNCGRGANGDILDINASSASIHFVGCNINESSSSSSGKILFNITSDSFVFSNNSVNLTYETNNMRGICFDGKSLIVSSSQFYNCHSTSNSGHSIICESKLDLIEISSCTFANCGKSKVGAVLDIQSDIVTIYDIEIKFDDVSKACKAIYIHSLSKVIIDKCSLINLSTSQFGDRGCGIIYNCSSNYSVNNHEEFLFSNIYFCNISGERACFAAGTAYDGQMTAENITIEKCDGQSFIWVLIQNQLKQTKPMIFRNVIFNGTTNEDRSSSGGTGIWYSSFAHPLTLIFESCQFLKCSGKSNGGAIEAGSSSPSIQNHSFDFKNCIFHECVGNDGGAIYLNTSSGYLSVINCSFSNLISKGRGGAIEATTKGPFTCINCSFINISSKHNETVIHHKCTGFDLSENAIETGNLYFEKCKSTSRAHIFHIQQASNSKVYIQNFTFLDCENTNRSLEIINFSSLYIYHCRFEFPYNDQAGCGFSVQGNEDFHLNNLTFINCKNPAHGGAFFYIGGENENEDIMIKDCYFDHCRAMNSQVFKIQPYLFVPTLENLTIKNCQGNYILAVEYIRNIVFNPIILKSCQFINIQNTNIDGGGSGIWINNFKDGVVTFAIEYDFINCTFCNNHHKIGGSKGGAIGIGIQSESIYASTVQFINCTFKNNSAQDGGAIYIRSSLPTTIKDCVFVNNSATNSGGSIFCFYRISANLTITNCNFTNSTIKSSSSGTGTAILLSAMMNPNVIRKCNFINCGEKGSVIHSQSDSTIQDCSFLFDSSENSTNGIKFGYAPNIDIERCLFRRCKADLYRDTSSSSSSLSSSGGGIYYPGYSYQKTLLVIIIDNIFDSCISHKGLAIYLNSNIVPRITGNRFYNHINESDIVLINLPTQYKSNLEIDLSNVHFVNNNLSNNYRVSGNVMSLSIIKSFLISHFLLISISKYVVSIGINNFFQSILPFCKN
ncbi:hypothetical protein TRFO_21128 [Tritrichomonas foetus]|uniref:Right handed beta helix domain-containing protein n=1 Tax=Tritrichomonas foetus TaxID=1144522 RepID=A0A1J4KF33_9EUKA|nr:hypothetical protein TRFO_21128 [Tritrichomonas foetus]|eukprot:OHT09787.1 hypothetical protein TRFO_21128 [Tritrichomonas foetus]